jgi:hypothetical protein
MPFCVECGTSNIDEAKFCTSCGRAMGNAAKPAAKPKSPAQFFEEVQKAIPTESVTKATSKAKDAALNAFDSTILFIKRFRKWLLLGLVVAIATTVALFVFVKPPYDPNNLPVLAAEYSADKLDEVAKPVCGSLVDAVTGSTAPDLDTLRAHNQRVSSTYDDRAALRVSQADWYLADEATLTSFKSNLDAIISPALDTLLRGNYRVNDSNRSQVVEKWLPAFQGYVANTCSVTDSLATVMGVVDNYTSSRISLEAKAANAPWYPVGYNEWTGDNNIAWRWTDRSCSYYVDYCWHVQVITNTGCPDGVYAEINIKDSAGNVIDYTNDSVPSLPAGSTAVLELSTSRSATGSLVTLNCHGD